MYVLQWSVHISHTPPEDLKTHDELLKLTKEMPLGRYDEFDV